MKKTDLQLLLFCFSYYKMNKSKLNQTKIFINLSQITKFNYKIN